MRGVINKIIMYVIFKKEKGKKTPANLWLGFT